MPIDMFELPQFDSEAARRARERAYSALRTKHRRALVLGATNHSPCARLDGQKHSGVPCDCCPACLGTASGMLKARFVRQDYLNAIRLEHGVSPDAELAPELIYEAIARDPGQSVRQWVSEGEQNQAIKQGLPAHPRSIRTRDTLVRIVDMHYPDPESRTSVRYVHGETAYLCWRRALDGDATAVNWAWVADSAVGQLQADHAGDGDGVDGEFARDVVLEVRAFLEDAPTGMKDRAKTLLTRLHETIYQYLTWDESTDADVDAEGNVREIRGTPVGQDPEVRTAGPHDELIDTMVVRALRAATAGRKTWPEQPTARERHLGKLLLGVLESELRARQHGLDSIGNELADKLVDEAAAPASFQLAQIAAAEEVGSAQLTDEELIAIARRHHQAWGRWLSDDAHDLKDIREDIRARAASRLRSTGESS